MLRSIDSLTGYRLSASDGEIGRCRDFLFDDRDWTLRYMVADTGGWLSSRKVLISPLALLTPDWATQHFPVALTREQIEQSPPLDAHAPVSREYEIAYHQYFAMPYYWAGAERWGAYPDPAGVVRPVPTPPPEPPPELEPQDRHLRSTAEVAGYGVHTDEGEAGSLHDFIVDDSSWEIRFLVIDTRRWLPGGKVLVPADLIDSVDWTRREVHCRLDPELVRNSPPYDPAQPINVQYERRLYDYYGRPLPPGEKS